MGSSPLNLIKKKGGLKTLRASGSRKSEIFQSKLMIQIDSNSPLFIDSSRGFSNVRGCMCNPQFGLFCHDQTKIYLMVPQQWIIGFSLFIKTITYKIGERWRSFCVRSILVIELTHSRLLLHVTGARHLLTVLLSATIRCHCLHSVTLAPGHISLCLGNCQLTHFLGRPSLAVCRL